MDAKTRTSLATMNTADLHVWWFSAEAEATGMRTVGNVDGWIAKRDLVNAIAGELVRREHGRITGRVHDEHVRRRIVQASDEALEDRIETFKARRQELTLAGDRQSAAVVQRAIDGMNAELSMRLRGETVDSLRR